MVIQLRLSVGAIYAHHNLCPGLLGSQEVLVAALPCMRTSSLLSPPRTSVSGYCRKGSACCMANHSALLVVPPAESGFSGLGQ